MDNFNQHDVIWTKEKVNRFWNFFVDNSSLLKLSFAKEVGRDILRITSQFLKKDSLILDYGCGGGALIGYLLSRGYTCQGLDASKDSVEATVSLFKNQELFKGAILSAGIPNANINNETYDFVYFIETIEHLLPDEVGGYLAELNRILKKGGYLFVSTPYNENLQKYQVICPDCGAVFHRVQHLNTFTVESLSDLASGAGFNKVFCLATQLMKPALSNFIKYFIRSTILKKDAKQHLIYLGQKGV